MTTRYTFGYDLNSRLTSADGYAPVSSVYTSQNDYVFNPTGWLTSETVNQPSLVSSTLTHTHDVAGRVATTSAAFTIASTTTTDYLTTYGRDAKGRVTTLQQTNSGSGSGYSVVAPKYAVFAYNTLDQITDIDRYANTSASNLVVHTDLDRDYLGRLTQIDHQKGSTHLAQYDFTHDAHHRITAVDEVFSNSAWNENHDMVYDDTDQLTSVDHSVQSDEAYAFDKNGNRTGNQTHLGATNSSTVTSNNRISTDGVYNYTYDDEGNRATRTNISTGEKHEYTWDHRNRLIRVTIKNSSNVVQMTIDFRYDERNLMVRRIENIYSGGVAGTNTYDMYVHDGQQIVLAFHKGTSGNAALTNRFVWGVETDQLLADEQVTSLSSAGTVYWVLADHLGTVRDLATYDSGLDTTTIVKHRTLDAFGNLVSDSASGIVEMFFFTGKIFEVTIGLQYNINRWYDPFAGRWISEDPIGFGGGTENLAEYVDNDPVSATDPSGLEKFLILTMRIAEIAKINSLGAKALTNYSYVGSTTADVNKAIGLSGKVSWKPGTAYVDGKPVSGPSGGMMVATDDSGNTRYLLPVKVASKGDWKLVGYTVYSTPKEVDNHYRTTLFLIKAGALITIQLASGVIACSGTLDGGPRRPPFNPRNPAPPPTAPPSIDPPEEPIIYTPLPPGMRPPSISPPQNVDPPLPPLFRPRYPPPPSWN